MVDEDLIKGNEIARLAISMLYESGVLQEQRLRLLEQLAEGPADETDEKLMEGIKVYRLRRTLIESLLELGKEFHKGEQP